MDVSSVCRAARGLPASVIPEFVAPLKLWVSGEGTTTFPNSMFYEVKAVTGALTLSTSQYQILGLIDVASRSPAGVSTIAKHPPPALIFTTTGNTTISPSVVQRATQVGVAIWQQIVCYDANTPQNNPDLYIELAQAMNENDVYPTALALPNLITGLPSTLTSPRTPPMPVPGDPDPPEVD
jgi:hypothetical protein